MSQKLKDELDRVRREMFEKGQARLPKEDRAWRLGQEMCGAKDQGYACTKARGHSGDHVAHGWPDGGVEHRWK